MRAKFFFLLTLLIVSSVSFVIVPLHSHAIAEQFTHKLKVDDSIGLLDLWGNGNGNGEIEPGENIKLEVELKNEGEDPVQNIVGTLSTKYNFVNIVDNKVNYGNIDPDRLYHAPIFDNFRFEISASAPTQVVTFTLTVTADNGGRWLIPIKLDIINPDEIDIDLPDDLISEVAFGATSTYFILKAKYPTLTGVSPEKISYGSCKITLHIPTDIQPFIFPIKTKGENVQETAIETGVKFIISLGLKEIPYASTIISVLDLFFKALNMENRDLTVNLQNLILDPERPKTEREHLVLLKSTARSLERINITIKQEYNLGGGVTRDEVERTRSWSFFSKGWAAPAAQPLAISDYPPFQLLPPEVQKYLLAEFAAFGTTETLLIPDETVMGQNYPNPFNPETWIPYQLAETGEVSITIYNTKGAVVRQLSLGHQPAGYYIDREHAAYWDGRNLFGELVASGLYFYQLTTDQTSILRKMVILR